MIVAGMVFFVLLAALGLTLWVTGQQQEIRSRAVNDVEFMLVTAPVRKKHNKSQIGVVLDKLDGKFKYRLVFTLTYTQTTSSSSSSFTPRNTKKTVKVHENKTYKFKYKTPPSCDWTANLDIQLYYRETKHVWKPVDASTAKGNSRQIIDCKNNIVLEEAVPVDESSLEESEDEAVDIDTLEDPGIIEQESAASISEAEPTAPPPPAGGPTATQVPIVPSPTSVAVLAPTNTPTPLPQNTAATKTAGSIGFFGNIGNSQTASPTRTPARGPTPSPFAIPTLIPTPIQSGPTRTQYLVDTSNAQEILPDDPPTAVDSIAPVRNQEQKIPESLILLIAKIAGIALAGGIGILFIISKIRDAMYRPRGPVIHPEAPLQEPKETTNYP